MVVVCLECYTTCVMEIGLAQVLLTKALEADNNALLSGAHSSSIRVKNHSTSNYVASHNNQNPRVVLTYFDTVA